MRLVNIKLIKQSNTNTNKNTIMGKMTLEECAQFYEKNGYVVVEDFLTQDEVKELKDEVIRYLDKHMKKKGIENEPVELARLGHSLYPQQFYLDTAFKLKFIHEECALDEEDLTKITPERRKQLYHRFGNGLHVLSKPFNRLMTGEKMKKLFAAFGYKDPVATYGSIIFKNPKTGRHIRAHQDGADIFTEPNLPVIGGWLALDDATEDNGCMEFLPGSHNMPIVRYLKRVKNPNNEHGFTMELVGPDVEDPEETQLEKFIKVPMKAGSMLLIHGNVYHRSGDNKSDKSRWAYVFHGFDAAYARWPDDTFFDAQTTLQLHLNNKAVD